MTEGVSTALASARHHSDETSRRTRDALEAASQILGDQQKGISGAMDGLAVALREMRGHGDRLDTMDQKLGAAFEQYRAQVEATMNGTAEQVRGIVEILNPALDTMKSVVEQAEHFAPQSSAGNNGVAWAAQR
jgi:ABC-type transporter Mla subunit MlaD